VEAKSISKLMDARIALETAIKEVEAKGFGEVRVIIQNKVIKRVIKNEDAYRAEDR
jgi:hypothetical protein